MPLQRGTRLGPYEVLEPIGAGGMGEVYRARDTRLDREVAIKSLPVEWSGDAERRSRFEREARAIAALTHAHICAIHDVGHHEGVDFLVMELLEGETLASRIQRGPLPLAQVLTHAVQIADALDQAHGRGVVHRDLKPGNVMLTRSGVKLLDFGLAKLRPDATPPTDGVTGTAPLTMQGQILGTLPYMAPEQLEGRPVDARTDLFAFGAIVHEMATGRRAFDQSSQASLIGAVLHAVPPPLTEAVAGAPVALSRIVSVCLSKDPQDRWSSAHDVLLQLREIPSSPEAARGSERATPGRDRRAWGVAGIAAMVALVLAVMLVADRTPVPADGALDILSMLPARGTTLDRSEAPQISPDGRSVAFVATDSLGRSGLYVRDRHSAAVRLVPDTDGATMPFWSPDSGSLGFFADGQLKTVSLAGGSAHAIAPAPIPRGGSWNREGMILFSAQPNLAPFLVPAAGGERTPVPLADGAVSRRLYPSFLPDGRHYLYLLLDNPRANRVVGVASIDSEETKDLLLSRSSVLHAAGRLLFLRDTTLVAQPFDVRTHTLSGAPTPIAEDVGVNHLTYQGLFSVSDEEALAYQPVTPGSELVWFDRLGRRQHVTGPAADYNSICLTPDGTRIVYDMADPASGSIGLFALGVDDNRPSKLTFGPAVDFYPVCSPTGADVAFSSLRDGPPNLFRLSVNTPGSEQMILQTPLPDLVTDWTRTGLIVYSVLNGETNFDIEAVPLAGGPATTVVATTAEERNGRVSPDGRWIAYVSNESGAFEVYVQPFPGGGAKWLVSTGGGYQPQWRADGRELFYLSPDRQLIGVAVRSGADFSIGPAASLFDTRITAWERANQGVQYAVVADGQRFLVNTAAEAIVPITLVLNWLASPAGR